MVSLVEVPEAAIVVLVVAIVILVVVSVMVSIGNKIIIAIKML